MTGRVICNADITIITKRDPSYKGVERTEIENFAQIDGRHLAHRFSIWSTVALVEKISADFRTKKLWLVL